MFYSWCNTLRNHPFACSALKNPAWWTEISSWFIQDLLPVFSRPLAEPQSLFFLFCHLSNGFLTASRPFKPAARSLLFSWNKDLLLSVLSCAWSCCTVSHLLHKLLTTSVLALGLPNLFQSGGSSSFQMPFDCAGNSTHWHLDFLCNFYKGKSTLLRVIMLTLKMVCLPLLIAFFSLFWEQYTTSCTTILSK